MLPILLLLGAIFSAEPELAPLNVDQVSRSDSPFAHFRQAAFASTLSGVVRSSEGGSPLSGARIRTVGEGSPVVFSDGSGRFELEGLSPGIIELEVQRLGYQTLRLSINIPASGAAPPPIEIRLVPDPLVLPGLVISASGELQRQVETAVSIRAITGEEIRRVAPSHPAEILNRIPGVWISPTSTEGHFTAIRQPITTKPVYLFLEDGVPTRSPGFFNHNALYEVNVPQADRIEVIRGPGTALYGSDAIGGVIDVGTRGASERTELSGSFEGSSLRFGRMLFSAAGTRGRDGVRLDLNLTEGDRWRDDATYQRQSATLRWDRSLSPQSGLRTTVAWSSVEQEDPSVVSRADLESNPSRNTHPITFRTVDALRIQSRFEHRIEGRVVQITPFVRWNSLDLMPSWMLGFDPVVFRSGHTSLGLMARTHFDLLSSREGRMTLGFDLDRSPGTREEDRIRVVRDQGIAVEWERLNRIYDYRATFLGFSPYAQWAFRPAPDLHVTLGVRADWVGFDYETFLPGLDTGPHRRPESQAVRYSNLGPSAGIAWTPRPALNLFGSVRESFRSPSEGQLFRQGSAANTVDLKPVKARNAEVGLRGARVNPGLSWEVTAYRLEIEDDILNFVRPEDGRTESVNAGKTRHSGVEIGVGARFATHGSADLSWTRARHQYLEWSPRVNVRYGGNDVEVAPRDLASARIGWSPPGVRLEAEWVHMGPYWLDPENVHRYDGHTLTNVRAEVALPRQAIAYLRVMNMTDRAHAERGSYNAFRGEEFSPGKPRTFHLGIRWEWAP
jgi:iron complex outermembrane receptor protein